MKKLLVISLVAIAAASASYYFFMGKGTDHNAMNPGGAPPAAVKVEKIQSQSITFYEELPGRTSAHKVSQIRPQVSGIITKRLFEEGSIVTEGQQLYQVDPAPYRAAYNRSLADLQKAKANAKAIKAKEDRYQELVKINAVSLQEYDDIKASLDQANADIAVANAMVATAKIDLDYTKVYAPISGRIGKSSVTEGALVSAGQAEPLATITQLDPIYVDMSQSSKDLMRMRGQINGTQQNPVEITLDGANQKYEEVGTLQFSDVSVDQTTSGVQLRALFPNKDERLLPGLFVRARIELGTRDVILVPQRATTRNPDGGLTVWTVGPDSTANPVPVSVEREYKDQWIVTSGLKAGDTVIVEGYQKIAPGMAVSTGDAPAGLIPAAENAAPAPATAPAEQPAPSGHADDAAPQSESAMPATDPATPQTEDASPEDMSAPSDLSTNPASPAADMSAKDLLSGPLEEAPQPPSEAVTE